MRRLLPLSAALACLALPTGALGASRPSFAHSLRGTISGSFKSTSSGRTFEASWKISGLVFRLQRVTNFEGGFTGIYKITRGTASITMTETGDCSYSASTKLGLAKTVSHTSSPLALDQDPLGRKTMLGLININRKIKTTESCPDPNGGPPATEQQTLDMPTLFDPGEKGWRPGRRLHGTNTQKDRGSKETWSWNLKPGR